MKNLVEMPLEDYNALVEKCTLTDREYEILKNALITPYGDGDSKVAVVLCAEADAKLLLELARRTHPDAASRMRQYQAAD